MFTFFLASAELIELHIVELRLNLIKLSWIQLLCDSTLHIYNTYVTHMY